MAAGISENRGERVMAGNLNLNSAKTARKDEFYTQLTDIEKEMRYYRKHFKGKTVLCNCDDPFESNFFKYFVLNFNRLGLKKLIATCYSTSPIAGNQLQYYEQSDGQLSFSFDEKCSESADSKRPYKAVVTKVYDVTGDGGIDMVDVAELFKSGDNALTQLNGDGDAQFAAENLSLNRCMPIILLRGAKAEKQHRIIARCFAATAI